MTLTIGTDAYSTLAVVRAYWLARGDTFWASLADAEAEVLIRKATDYIDRGWSFIGDKATAAQRLKWPRKYADVEGHAIDDTVIPWQIEEATAMIAEMYRVGTIDMEGIVTDKSAAVILTKVDVITTQYDANSRLLGKAIASHVHELLRPLTSGQAGLLRA